MRKFILFIFLITSMTAFSQDYYLFIGTYTNGKSEGVYVHRFNSASGKLEPVSVAKGVENPTYLTVAPGGKYVYVANENGGAKPGEVSAFSFDAASGKLSFINKQSSGGDGPCYVMTDSKSKWLLVGNYSAGSLAALPIKPDGSLSPAAQVIQHSGKGVMPQQDKAHVHATVLSPDEHFVFAPDLGIDKLMIYSFNPQDKQPLKTAKVPYAVLNPGSGPRHFTFHPSRKFAYVIEEISGNVSAYSYDQGKLTFLQRIAGFPEGFNGNIDAADIHISPDGKFLYSSTRGEVDKLAIFAIDSATGKLTLVNLAGTGGTQPRNFIIDPTGQWLLVANQRTSNVVIFKRDMTSGLLENKGQVEVPNPVCLQFLKIQ